MDFWSANWIWLLLGLAVIWMLMSRGGRDRLVEHRRSMCWHGEDVPEIKE